LSSRILSLAARVIGSADRKHPADSVLRQELKAARQIAPAEAAQISAAVFAYFRWVGWLDVHTPVQDRILHAQDLAARFDREPESFSDGELLARAVPGWLTQEMEIDAVFVRALQTEPKLWLRARAGQGSALAKKLGDCRPYGGGRLADILEYHGKRDLFRRPEFHDGEFELQDISSQAAGLICDARPGETWWDACAGEGGKTLQLSDQMQNQGLIWASDRAAWRLQRLKRRAARAKAFNYRSVPWDGGKKLPMKALFDGVLVDAPCSGVGTWHRNPQGRWTTTEKDVEELGLLQTRLLAHAAAAVKPGGKLVYAVCTLTRRETVAVADEFERAFGGFETLQVQNPLSAGLGRSPRIWLWPQRHGGNGMFVAAWRRR